MSHDSLEAGVEVPLALLALAAPVHVVAGGASVRDRRVLVQVRRPPAPLHGVPVPEAAAVARGAGAQGRTAPCPQARCVDAARRPAAAVVAPRLLTAALTTGLTAAVGAEAAAAPPPAPTEPVGPPPAGARRRAATGLGGCRETRPAPAGVVRGLRPPAPGLRPPVDTSLEHSPRPTDALPGS